MPQLAADHLTLRAGDKPLVEGLTLGFASGENWAILGANGSGKTTLLHALVGLRPADSGGVRLDGRELRAVPRRERARHLGLLFQDPTPAFPATVLETALTGRHPHLGRFQTEGTQDLALTRAALAAVDLDRLAARPLTTLSGGERRRVEIAALLAQDPPVCLLDEPVNHLDPHYQISLLRLLTDRTRRPGHVNLLVLHDINLALRFCSHALLLLGDGHTRHGPIGEVVDAPTLERVYRCAMREITTDRDRWFIPSDENP
jgi:iron complex transport system ATP-binding protein